jgi:nitroreductase
MSAAHPAGAFVPLVFERRTPEESLARAREFRAELARRRSVRHFRSDPLPPGVIDECLLAAGSSPSGAHRQPWTFVVVADSGVKREIRLAAEEEERKLYGERISDQWREALAPLGTDWRKPFLETAPALIAVFRHAYDLDGARKVANYYTQESVGIACGMLLAALHHAGLATLTHTPSPMAFLQRILRRPEHERAFLLIPVGYPAQGCLVPDLARKPLDEIRVVV